MSQDPNAVVHSALTTLAAACVAQAKALEALAATYAPGVSTPVEAAAPAAASAKAAKAKPEKVAAAPQSKISAEDLRKYAVKLIDKVTRPALTPILNKYGVTQIKELPADQLDAFYGDLMDLEKAHDAAASPADDI